MKPQTEYYIGIMSGTSLDGVDLVLMDFANGKNELVDTDFTPMPKKLKEKLTALLQGKTSLQQLGEVDHQLGLLYSHCVNQFLNKLKLTSDQIRAIGCHGQTIWHAPHGKYPFTMQIGDANLIAARTKISVIADFRRKDMASGGQGAPLVPAFHQAIFADPARLTVILNIGGISNISILYPDFSVIGYDTGTGNILMDLWVEKLILGYFMTKMGNGQKQEKLIITYCKIS